MTFQAVAYVSFHSTAWKVILRIAGIRLFFTHPGERLRATAGKSP